MRRAIDVQAEYDRIAADGMRTLLTGQAVPEALPTDGEPRWGVSAVLRPAGQTAASMMQLIAELGLLADEEHLWYAESGLHTTIRSIEPFRTIVPGDDKAVAGYFDALVRVASATPHIGIEYRGVIASPSGVLVQGLPQSAALQECRERLHAEIQDKVPANAMELKSRRVTAHVSLGVFRNSQLHQPRQLADYIKARKELPLGLVTYDHIDLVRYHFTPDQIDVSVLGTASLGTTG
jgi:hypothetical protein